VRTVVTGHGQLGGAVMRIGLVLILAYHGALKLTENEALAIQPLVEHNPAVAWLYQILSVPRAAQVMGGLEIGIAALIAARAFSALACFTGSVAAVVVFGISLSMLVTTPQLFTELPGFPLPIATPVAATLVKDVVLMGAALWSASEARRAMSISMD
jgi:uncharacterized membrane protein YkgB